MRRAFLTLLVCLTAMAPAGAPQSGTPQPLAGTDPLRRTGDLALGMVESIHTWLDRQIERSSADRDKRWARDFSTPAAYSRSVESHRVRFRKAIGVVERREPIPALTVLNSWPPPPHRRDLAAGAVRVEMVRWPVFPGLDAEGLLLVPAGPPVARIVALPDADWPPEYISGLQPAPLEHQFARRLAESGCLVLVPMLIDRSDTWSGNRDIRFTNQPHREFIYRAAFEMGRHILGYEVQKVLAAVDFLAAQQPAAPIGVAGYGEGGLVALYSAASDTRIEVTLVSGSFRPREGVWQEPIYRNVWGLLAEFGDAEVASLIVPRGLVVEMSRHPEIAGPPLEREGRRGAAPGRIATPTPQSVEAEFARVRSTFSRAGVEPRCTLVRSGDGLDEPVSEKALNAFLERLEPDAMLAPPSTNLPAARASGAEQAQRLQRQFTQMVEYTQAVVRRADAERRRFWARADASSVDKWQSSTESYRRYLDEEVLGKLPASAAGLRVETRLAYETPAFRGYEAVIPVLDEIYAYGVLLIPKDLKPGERRPVVVCQHGLEGRPTDLIEPPNARAIETYQRFAAALAERGFIVYAPQNPYIGGDRFRTMVRKANPLRLSLYSFIIAQHRRTLDWLSSLEFVDPARIGFYGLSYGGKTAMRVPALDARYAVAICSGDFNEWIWKITSVDAPFSYMFTHEYEIIEFDLGNTFNYAELAGLIAPRPFMVERGMRDPVGIDEWVAYEYAKVRRFYTGLGLSDRTTIEFFPGPHRIHGVGTFDFLHRHLNWPVQR